MESLIREHLSAQRYREAFELLLELYQNKVFRLGYGMLHSESKAQDIAQEVFLKIWKALPHFNGNSSPSTWIYSITRNTCLTEISAQARRQVSSLDDPAISFEANQAYNQTKPVPGDDLDVRAMVQRLPPKYRQVITMFYLEERSYEEAAARLGMPIGTFKTYIHRAKKQLAAMSRTARSGRCPLTQSTECCL